MGAPAWKEPEEAVLSTAMALLEAAFEELFREGAMMCNGYGYSRGLSGESLTLEIKPRSTQGRRVVT